MKLKLNHQHSPQTLARLIMEEATGSSYRVVAHHLVGARLTKRFKNIPIPNRPVHAGDKQTERAGDFAISKLVYHVTAAPSRGVLQKCADNLKAGLHPLLLVPRGQKNKTEVLAQDEGIGDALTIMSIEDFVALNIIEVATEEDKDFFSVLSEIVEIYNKRLAEVETDLSLQIEVK